MVEPSSRPSSALLHVDIENSIPSSNESIPSAEDNLSMTDSGSDCVEPTHDSPPEDKSCSGLADIQVCALDFFSARLASSSIPTDIHMFADCADPDESRNDDSDPLIDNPDPSFDRDNPIWIPTKVLPLNSISPSQHPFAPFNPDESEDNLIPAQVFLAPTINTSCMAIDPSLRPTHHPFK